MLNVAVVGCGGLGKSHIGNLKKMQNEGSVNVKALCDVDETKFYTKTDTNLGGGANVDLENCKLYADAEDMFAKEELDFVIIATPSFLHAQIAIKALEHGLNVFSEKPMALAYKDCEAMLAAKKKSGKRLMIGQCLRYWPAYVKLKQIVAENTYGRVIQGDFSRFSGSPKWSWNNWYMNHEMSGGAPLDLHIHDVDMINYLFGSPEYVSAAATHVDTEFDSIAAVYGYSDKYITASATWGLAQKYGFRMSFLVRFERAVARMDSGGAHVYTDDEVFDLTADTSNAFYNEVTDFVNCINENRESTINPPESSAMAVKIALAEKEAALEKKIILLK